ncbi:unnamed protein product [Ilex paraguariensis]|uniref:Pentatricopeptide repeat-containing protein n=1 Tax=Ilex paraguariensis TaxID=185542 RepID=A0ABC8UHE5_9AQUA
MQSLTIWPLRRDSLIVPQLDFELGTPLNSRTSRRRKRWDRLHFVCHIKRPVHLLVSSNLKNFGVGACHRSQNHDFGSGFFSVYYSLEVHGFCVPKRGSFGASFALAWASEEQAIGSEVMKENSNPLNGLLEKGEAEGLTRVNIEELSDSDMPLHGTEKGDGDGGGEEEEDINNKEEVRCEKSKRVDVRALARSLHFAKTIDDVEDVLKCQGELPLQVYSSLIRSFGVDKRLDLAMAIVEWLKRKKMDSKDFIGPNLFIYNSLLGAVKQAEKFQEAEKVMHDMVVEGVDPNVVTYNTLMGIYIEQGREAEALNLFEEIRKKGLSPSPASYSTALLAYRRLEDGFGALKFYGETIEKYQKGEIGKCPDEDWENEFAKLENFTIRICYQVMRRWLVKSEPLSANVLKLLADMDRSALQIGHAECERLVWACTREEHYIVAKKLYNRIRERDSEISLSVCNHVIWLMGKAKKWWAALEIYEDLLDKGPKPNNMSYELIVSHFNILLTAARKRGIWRWGVRLLNKMEEKGLKPGSREWNAVLVACSKAAETSAAVQIFRRMVEQGEKPTIVSYGALLSALEKGKLYDEALHVWKHMIKVGVEPNLYAYTIMASIYAGQGKFNIVDSIIQEMISSRVEPTVVTFNAIISGCARNNMGSAAYEWFQRMKFLNISPNDVTYEMLIEALANDDKPRLAYDMYLRARIEGLNLSSKAYDAVIRSSQVCGATIDVSALGPRPPEKKKKLQIRKDLSEFCNLADVPRRSKPFDRKEIHSSQTE